MTVRFASNLLTLLVGAFLMAERFAFAAGPGRWLAFGGGCAIVVTTLAAFPAPGRGAGQRLIDVSIAAASGWLIVASLTLSLSTAGWMAFAVGSACAALALAGLIAHEAITERAVARLARDVERAAPATGGADTRAATAPVVLRARSN